VYGHPDDQSNRRPLPTDLTGRVVIVTGAGSGIGAATASALALRGAAIVVAELDPHSGDATSARLVDDGHEAVAVPTDISDEASVRAMAEAAHAWRGRIEGLVNNAALTSVRSGVDLGVVDTPIDAWRGHGGQHLRNVHFVEPRVELVVTVGRIGKTYHQPFIYCPSLDFDQDGWWSSIVRVPKDPAPDTATKPTLGSRAPNSTTST
jgi:hypothetical protein